MGGVHDLHVWSLTSGVNAMSVHVVASDTVPYAEVLRAVHDRVGSELPGSNIQHVTVQVEPPGWERDEKRL